jgi:CRISPR-associated protein Cas2
MWMVVMFDLPVVEKAERKAATAFRNTLLDQGFEMSQFSVYMRFCTSSAQVCCRRPKTDSLKTRVPIQN